MPQRTLRFKIRQDGVVEETVEGIVGQACQGLTEKLESALGKVEHQEFTPDAYLIPEQESQLIQEKTQQI